MAIGRPPLRIGTYRTINVRADPRPDGKPNYRARTRYRDRDGVTRDIVRYGQTKGRAEDALRAAILERQHHDRAATIRPETRLADVADLWYADEHNWSSGTRETYAYILAVVKGAVGDVRVREALPPLLSRAVTSIRDDNGPGAAKTAKTVLTGMLGMAVTHGAIAGNPAREIVSVLRTERKKAVRALTKDEQTDLCDRLRSDADAVAWDLPDLVEWMLGTGARIGEACAAREGVNDEGAPLLDLAAGTWEIDATVIRVSGVKRLRALEAKQNRTWEDEEELVALRTLTPGLHIQHRTKTAAGWRVLALPAHLVEMLERRRTELRMARVEGVVFGSPRARALRDKSNTSRDLRPVLDRLGYGWVTSHTFRKTVATRLLEAGFPVTVVSNQLGHARPSLTLDVYAGRQVVSAEAARVLDR